MYSLNITYSSIVGNIIKFISTNTSDTNNIIYTTRKPNFVDNIVTGFSFSGKKYYIDSEIIYGNTLSTDDLKRLVLRDALFLLRRRFIKNKTFFMGLSSSYRSYMYLKSKGYTLTSTNQETEYVDIINLNDAVLTSYLKSYLLESDLSNQFSYIIKKFKDLYNLISTIVDEEHIKLNYLKIVDLLS